MSENAGVKLLAVKGMNDVLPPDSAKWAAIERCARAVFHAHGYRELRTPIVEYTPLFVRSIGEATDVVEKEMYTFTDRGDRMITLRPEGTASAVRALLEHGELARDPVVRWYYAGPMFRHERAQRGRYRQFYQLGVEAFGVGEPTIDAEQIAMLVEIFTSLGIGGLETLVNSVGGAEDRPRYRAALVAHLEPRRDALCPDCQRRLGTNPLRVLDCKSPSCQTQVADAPSILDHLGDAARAHLDGVRAGLDALGVAHRVEPRLVRGLDYYTGTTFEVRVTGGDLGAQNTLGAGGRYDALVAELGGPATPAIGFAFGMERVALTMPAPATEFEPKLDVYLAAHGAAARLACLGAARELRAAGLVAEMEHRAVSLKAQLKRANRFGARAVVVIGDTELAEGVIVLRDMQAGTQERVPRAELVAATQQLRERL